MDDLPEITILTPVYERNNFLMLYLTGILGQDYPKEKIHILIHECQSNNPFMPDIETVRRQISPVRLTNHINISGKMSIGQKRNWLAKNCETEYFAFFDSDDIYLPTALLHSVGGLMKSGRGFAGSPQMIFVYPLKDFQTRMINCGDDPRMIHEATICSTKSFFKKHKLRFGNTSQGESEHLLDHVPNSEILLTNCAYLMLCLCHDDNTISKDMFLNKKYTVETNFDDFMKSQILSIFKD